MSGIYGDGGVIGSNPSEIGGTWAVRWVEEGQVLLEKSGVVIPGRKELPGIGRMYARPSGMGKITNNLTEMIAIVRALQCLPKNWTGTVYSDSQVTLGRVFDCWKWSGIPNWLHLEYQHERFRLVNWVKFSHVLLQGHPTRKELEAGIGKSGRPVSEHNVWCDKECGRQAAKYLEFANPGKVPA